MKPGPDPEAAALQVIRDQLQAGRDAAKCHACGCFQQFVEGLAATGPGREHLADEIARSRSVFQPRRYDCLGCSTCFPALGANAFQEAFPDQQASLDACPTGPLQDREGWPLQARGGWPPQARKGWPPLPGDYRVVRHGAPVAVCTLNSEALAAQVADLAPAGLALAGTLRTENLGIERLVQNVRANPNLRFLVLCGEDTRQAVGHLPGQSLQSLMENGLEADGRIRGAKGRRPFLRNLPAAEVEAFRNQVTLVTRIGELDPQRIAREISGLAEADPGPFRGPASGPPVPVLKAPEPGRLVLDPAGFVVVYPDRARALLRVEHYTNAGVLDAILEGSIPAALSGALIDRGLVTRLDHAAYLGRELARAERSLATGEPYVQDRAPGTAAPEPGSSCGCPSCA